MAPRVPLGLVRGSTRGKKIKKKKGFFCKASSAQPRGFHTQVASETQTNHRGLGSSHSASVWARLETLLQGRLCLLNSGQQVEQPSTRPWEGGTAGLPGHFPEPCGFTWGQGGQGKGREPLGREQAPQLRARTFPPAAETLGPRKFPWVRTLQAVPQCLFGLAQELPSACVYWGQHIPAGLERCPGCLCPRGGSPLGSGGPRHAFTFNQH